jgi:8-oxo-dGTP diphosphatase
MRDWTVGAALMLSDEGLLLVHNRRHNGSEDWTPPGGVIEEGEALLVGLTREVQEETGLTVTEWGGPVYEVRCVAPDMGWNLRVEVHVALAYEGELHVDDPDGIVVDARFVGEGDLHAVLAGNHPWVLEPLADWLTERWSHDESRPYGFHVAGAAPDDVVVTRAEL